MALKQIYDHRGVYKLSGRLLYNVLHMFSGGPLGFKTPALRVGQFDIVEGINKETPNIRRSLVVVIQWDLLENIIHLLRIEGHLDGIFATAGKENDERKIFTLEQLAKCADEVSLFRHVFALVNTVDDEEKG